MVSSKGGFTHSHGLVYGVSPSVSVGGHGGDENSVYRVRVPFLTPTTSVSLPSPWSVRSGKRTTYLDKGLSHCQDLPCRYLPVRL